MSACNLPTHMHVAIPAPLSRLCVLACLVTLCLAALVCAWRMQSSPLQLVSVARNLVARAFIPHAHGAMEAYTVDVCM